MNEGITATIPELIELKNDLCWRWLSDERPEGAGCALCYSFDWCRDNWFLRDYEILREATYDCYWIPLSALPKPEGEE